MANASAAGTVWNCPNYVGELYLIGANQTPFLNAIGGLQNGIVRTVAGWEFSLNQNYALESAAQPAITETASLTAPTATTYVRAQDVNTCQIFQKQISVSYAKQSNAGTVSGIAIVSGEVQPVQNELDFQTQAALRQVALDAEYTFLNGAYQKATNAGVAAKTRGIITACTTNTVAASSAALSETLINDLLEEMATNGARFERMAIFGNAYQIRRINAIYKADPDSRTDGGRNITRILTPFCELQVLYAPQVSTSTLLIADLAVCQPVFLPVPGKGVLFREELSRTGASESYQLYGQMGLDYGHESFHGTITGLATSGT